LGERLNGIQEVVGSIPISSTSFCFYGKIAGSNGSLIEKATSALPAFSFSVIFYPLKKQQ
jgi:hypothetical protein